MKKSTPSVLQTKAIIIGSFKATALVGDKPLPCQIWEPDQRQNQIKSIDFPPKQNDSDSLDVASIQKGGKRSTQGNEEKTSIYLQA